jgi:hypothetical protein
MLPGAGAAPEPAPARKPPWYRRRAVLLTAGVVVVLAVTIVSDLPAPSSKASQAADDRTLMRQVNSDLAPCAYAAHEAFTVWREDQAGTLTASDRASIPSLLRDDQMACSFTSDTIYQLSTVEVPGSSSGRHLGDLVGLVTLWATSDALGAIEDLQTLTGSPGDASAHRDLAARERSLAADRGSAERQLHDAVTIVGQSLPRPDLPALPVPAGAS